LKTNSYQVIRVSFIIKIYVLIPRKPASKAVKKGNTMALQILADEVWDGNDSEFAT